MTQVGNGLLYAKCHEDASKVYEDVLSTLRRIGKFEEQMLVVQNNLAMAYTVLGQIELVPRMRKDVYSGYLRIYGEEHMLSFAAANNYASTLSNLKRFEEAKALSRRTLPVVRRVLGESNDLTLRMRATYARAFYENAGATLDDLRVAVTTLAETALIARRVHGSTHPFTNDIEDSLRETRAMLRARETPSAGSA